MADVTKNVTLKRSTGSAWETIYVRTTTSLVDGLLDGTTIKRALLPKAGGDYGAVKISDAYAGGTATDVAINQKGTKALYDDLNARIGNLESPLDFLGSISIDLAKEAPSHASISTQITNKLVTLGIISSGSVLHPGHTILNNNTLGSNASWVYSPPSAIAFTTEGYWLWIYNGSLWEPAVKFPNIPAADYSGANQNAMVEGIITQAMLWKLKGIEAGAQVNTVTSVAGKTGAVTVTKSDVGLGSADNKSSATIRGEITSANVTSALGFTPYNATNPNNYIAASGAPVQSVAGRTGAVTLAKADVGLGSVDNTADSAKSVAKAAQLTTARTIAGVSFNGTANIAIPFANLSTKPTSLAGYGIPYSEIVPLLIGGLPSPSTSNQFLLVLHEE